MAGVKNRSGKVVSLEAKQARSESGKKGMASRWGKTALPPAGKVDPTSDDPVARLGRPLTWGDELKRQQVEGERIQNRRREVEVQRAAVELAKAEDERALARGDLLTAEAHGAAVSAVVDAILAEIPALTSAALNLVPAERQPECRVALGHAERRLREAAAAAITRKAKAAP